MHKQQHAYIRKPRLLSFHQDSIFKLSIECCWEVRIQESYFWSWKLKYELQEANMNLLLKPGCFNVIVTFYMDLRVSYAWQACIFIFIQNSWTAVHTPFWFSWNLLSNSIYEALIEKFTPNAPEHWPEYWPWVSTQPTIHPPPLRLVQTVPQGRPAL